MEDTTMSIKGINELLEKYNGKDATIRISHKLFGTQKIELELEYIFDEDRIGFRAGNGQEIFIYTRDIHIYKRYRRFWCRRQYLFCR